MRYFLYVPSTEFDAVGLCDADEDIIKMHFKSASFAHEWRPIKLHGFPDDAGAIGDFPCLNDYMSIPVFSDRAWSVLKSLIGYCSEPLPVEHPSGRPFYLINVMEIIDCLDEERSELTRNDVTGRVSRVYKYCLKFDLLEDKHIFKLPLKSGADLLVSEEFRRLVKANDLKGLRFEELPMVNC